MKKKIFTKEEFIFILLIGVALGFRQVAMNLVTPFVATYCSSLTYGTLTLAGIALGIFGLTQGIFQIPFGAWSDKFGYKKMILIGVFIMGVGIILATIANNAYLFVFARALQGAGAITSAGYAWLSSSLSYEKRTDAISIVGVIVGISSAFAFGGSPILAEFMSVRDILLLASLAIIIMFFIILFFLKDIRKSDNSIKTKLAPPSKKESFEYIKKLIDHKCYFAIIVVAFINGFVGVAGMFIIPEYCKSTIGSKNMWIVLTPAIIISIILMRLSTKYVKRGHGKQIAIISTLCLLTGTLLFLDYKNVIILLLGSIALLTGYNILFTLTPTVVNLVAIDRFRGIANGSANLFFYIGDFIGTTIVGGLWTNHSFAALIMLIIFSFLALLFSIFIIPTFKSIKIVN